MPKFGVADPIYDSLRLRSNDALIASTGTIPGTGSGLLNRIYLWPADGSTISDYDPNEAGLTAAIAAAVSGDTVWLPSIPIACTTARTIPAGVKVAGLSYGAALSFSGFPGAALVLSAGSIIQDFTLNHVDGLWFDASADSAKALRIHGTAQRAIIGSTVPIEPWFATASDVFWLDRAINNWHKITPGLGTINNFYIRADGSMAFLYIPSVGWYKGETLKTSPTWTQIATDAGNILRHGSCDGTNFYMVDIVDYPTRTWHHGTYNGTSWSYGSNYSFNWFSPDCTGKDFACYWGEVFSYSGALIETTLYSYLNNTSDGWVSSGGTRYAWTQVFSNNHIVLRTPGVTSLVDVGVAGDASLCIVRGAISGPHIYAVDFNGALHYSANGSTFSNVATWEPGFANDTLNAGGGDLVWVKRTILNGTVPARLYAVSGWGSTDLTYNFWSLTTGDQTVYGSGVVFP